jgi:hypothetical protein
MNEVQQMKISDVDWAALSSDASCLYSPESLSVYDNLDLLAISIQGQLAALWPIPFVERNGQKMAQREIRLLPYHAPILLKPHPIDRRSLMSAFIEYLQTQYQAIDLPLSPGFHDLSSFSAMGMFVEWRNTHRFSPSHSFKDHIHSKAKNHIGSAQNQAEVHLSTNPEEFDFVQGIVTTNESHRTARKRLACRLIEKGWGMVFTAKAGGERVGQALVVHDRQTSYLFHSWYQKNRIRGIPSLLISAAIDWTFEVQHLPYFDLEGSIIPSVDRFFAGLGGMQTPYAYIQWCKDRSQMLRMIEECIFLPLRLEKQDCVL